jgi:hypothetical protein
MFIVLVITYLSTQGEIHVRSYPVESMKECKMKQKQLHKTEKAGKISSVCWSSERKVYVK